MAFELAKGAVTQADWSAAFPASVAAHITKGRSETATDMLSSVKVPKQRHLFQVECRSLRNIRVLRNVVFIRR
jgi:hypothetical protein